ncbi:TetR/AcrR family transcriptional regulator [Nocardioides psychrotolerans]|uniref:TetR/AcrR family transcriptional regulator n=1 Tax=Nocardioides psychrotolerans TaxID=1005945 RepID=UPI003137F1E1
MSTETDGRSSRWDAHREERRTELIAAAVRAIDEQGPEVNMTDIAGAAGVSKPVLYRYFADKDELHAAVGQWGADEVLAGVVPALLVDAPVRTRIEAAVDAYLRVIEEHPQVFFLLVRHRASGDGAAGDPLADGKARIAATLSRFLSETMRGLGVDPGGAEPWAQGIVGLGLATGEWWLEKRTMPRAAISGYLSAFVWHSLEGPATELGVPLSALDVS